MPLLANTETTIESPGENPSGALIKGLGLFDATMLVAGSMIGSGILSSRPTSLIKCKAPVC